MSLQRGTAPPRGPRGLLQPRVSRAWPGVAGLLPAEETRQRRLLLPLSPGRQRFPRSGTDCASVGQWVICLRPGQRAALTCSHRLRHRGRETGEQPWSAASPRRGPQSSLGTAPGTRPKIPPQRRVLSRRLQVPSQSALRSRWLPARLPARAARGGGTVRGLEAGRAGGGVSSSLAMGKAGRGSSQSCPSLQAAPSWGPWTLSLLAANLSLPVHPQPLWNGWVSRSRGNWRFWGLVGLGLE